MFLIVCGIIITMIMMYYKKYIVVNFMYIFVIKCINVYTYLTVKIMKYLPSLIYTKTFTYKSNLNNKCCEIDFDISEYKCNLNGRFYKVRFLDNDNKKEKMYDFIKNIKSKIEEHNLITHACLINKENYVKDITDELRSFFHYIPLNNMSSEDFINKLKEHDIFQYIKTNIEMNDNNILVCLNDNNLTDILIK